MDTNNLDKWWYGLPENSRQAIGNDEIWEKKYRLYQSRACLTTK